MVPLLLRFKVWIADRTGRQYPRALYFRPNGEPLPATSPLMIAVALMVLVVCIIGLVFAVALLAATLFFAFVFFRALFDLWHS